MRTDLTNFSGESITMFKNLNIVESTGLLLSEGEFNKIVASKSLEELLYFLPFAHVNKRRLFADASKATYYAVALAHRLLTDLLYKLLFAEQTKLVENKTLAGSDVYDPKISLLGTNIPAIILSLLGKDERKRISFVLSGLHFVYSIEFFQDIVISITRSKDSFNMNQLSDFASENMICPICSSKPRDGFSANCSSYAKYGDVDQFIFDSCFQKLQALFIITSELQKVDLVTIKKQILSSDVIKKAFYFDGQLGPYLISLSNHLAKSVLGSVEKSIEAWYEIEGANKMEPTLPAFYNNTILDNINKSYAVDAFKVKDMRKIHLLLSYFNVGSKYMKGIWNNILLTMLLATLLYEDNDIIQPKFKFNSDVVANQLDSWLGRIFDPLLSDYNLNVLSSPDITAPERIKIIPWRVKPSDYRTALGVFPYYDPTLSLGKQRDNAFNIARMLKEWSEVSVMITKPSK